MESGAAQVAEADLKINPKIWQDSVRSIVELGKTLAERRRKLDSIDFKLFVRSKHLLDVNSAYKIIRLGTHPIISKPENWPRLPPQWAKLYIISFFDNELLQKIIDDGTVWTLKRGVINQMRREMLHAGNGERIKELQRQDKKKFIRRIQSIPEGETIIDLGRRGLDLERNDGLVAPEVSKRLKIGLRSYGMLRHFVLLSERTDLAPKEVDLVNLAVRAAIKYGNPSASYDIIEPLVKRIWGRNTGASHVTSGTKIEKSRKEAFEKAMVIICDTCSNGADITIPQLTTQDKASAISRLIEARSSLIQLAKKIRGSGQ